MTRRMPIVGYLCLDDGPPHLRAHECVRCGALFFDRRNACSRCGRRTFRNRALATEGTVSTFSIVHQTAPNVEVPFVSAVVELAGGGAVKTTIREIEPEPSAIRLGMPVQLTTFVVGTDDDGTEAVAFAFVPATNEGVAA